MGVGNKLSVGLNHGEAKGTTTTWTKTDVAEGSAPIVFTNGQNAGIDPSKVLLANIGFSADQIQALENKGGSSGRLPIAN